MSTEQLAQIILLTVAENFDKLLIIIAAGAGIKIVLDIIFKSLYSITNPR